ncbi:MAG: ABC transporter permease subunit [Pyrinomonadaceae bacterium]
MAVYEQTYQPYEGALTSAWSRFLILPRYTYRSIFQSKLFLAFFCVCFLPTLVAAIMIYLHYNINALAIMNLRLRDLVAIDAEFFRTILAVQGVFTFLLTVLTGPVLISRDVSNNALPLYLCRPFSRVEYIAGKMSVLLVMLSVVSWVPSLLLFLFQAYLAGPLWLAQNARVGVAIVLAGLIGVITYSLLVLAISAWVKWRMAASAAFFALFLIPSSFGGIINNLFNTNWGNLLNIGAQLNMISNGLFGLFTRRTGSYENWRNGRRTVYQFADPPLWSAWAAILMLCVFCLFLLARKIRAYEMVR